MVDHALMSFPAPTTAAPPSELTPEPCPPPLAWQDVLEEFRARRTSIPFIFQGRTAVAHAFGAGRPLCFLNPAAGDCELFALTAWLLRDECECLLLDYPPLRPIGSPLSALNQCGAALQAAVDVWGHGRFSVIAAGFGSLVALHLMSIEPDDVESAILVCGSARRRLSLVERGLLAWGRVWPGPVRRIPGWLAVQQQNHRRWFPPFDATRWEFLLDNLGATPTAQLARRMSVMGGVDLRLDLPQIRQPVLLVRTEGEGAVSAACQDELAAGLPHAQSEWLHTTGQLPYLTHPHRLAKLVKSFLLKEPSPQPAAASL
jgi:pimeloyl-ACP methyl ester carboxylesterase